MNGVKFIDINNIQKVDLNKEVNILLEQIIGKSVLLPTYNIMLCGTDTKLVSEAYFTDRKDCLTYDNFQSVDYEMQVSNFKNKLKIKIRMWLVKNFKFYY